MKYAVSVLVEDEPGVLSRLTNLFVRRGFNIVSLAVGPTHMEAVSRMTIVVEGTEAIVTQLMNQLLKFVEVISVANVSVGPAIERELGLLKVYTPTPEIREELQSIGEIYKIKLVEVTADTVTYEVVGDPGKVTSFYDLISSRYQILESVRTGLIALSRVSGVSTEFLRREADVEEKKKRPAVVLTADLSKEPNEGELKAYSDQFLWELI